jgi:hypothetical protein
MLVTARLPKHLVIDILVCFRYVVRESGYALQQVVLPDGRAKFITLKGGK